MNNLFDSLIISSPNGGGVFLFHNNDVFRLDNFDTTGLSVIGRKLIRGIQPSSLVIYDNNTIEINQDAVPFQDIHDVLLHDQFIYFVGTSGNEIVKLSSKGLEIQRWVFPGEKDSLHINCLAVWNGRIVFSAFGEFRDHRGYKGKTTKAGFVQDLHTGEHLITGLSQPHSLVSIDQSLILANSENMEISEYGTCGNLVRSKTLGGYTRGICVTNKYIYVGLSCSRNINDSGVATATFIVLDGKSWDELYRIELPTTEIYAIQAITNTDELINVLAKIATHSSSKLASAITERDSQISQVMSELDVKLKDKDAQIGNVESAVKERDRHIVSLDALVKERTEWAQSLDKELEERTEWAQSLDKELKERTEWAQSLDKELKERTEWAQSLDKELKERTEWAQSLDKELKAKNTAYENLLQSLRDIEITLNGVYNSISWRITYPLRLTKAYLKKAKNIPGKIRTLIASRLRSAYRKIPLSDLTKWYVKSFIFKTIAPLIRNTSTYERWRQLQESFEFKATDDPMVSIIIPVYNNIEFTHRCLRSIYDNKTKYSYEIIVVDDNSNDATRIIISRFSGIHIIINNENIGFIRSCNKGAAIARGKYLLFLNNDTQVLPDWMDELVDTFDAYPDAGFVGSKLIYPNGQLQEAGGIIWNDASGWNYGRNDDPNKPEYNYLLEVDYCSGASIMLPKDLFLEVSGFDERYIPAYYEDTDLAFSVRKVGRKVFYQPLSKVIHFEGVTSGKNVTTGIKAYQVDNQHKFYEKWKEILMNHGAPGNNPYLERDRNVQKRILIIDACTPTPDQDAGSVNVFSYLQILKSLSFKITFIPASNFSYDAKYTVILQQMGIECLYAPFVTNVESHIREYGRQYDVVMLYRVVIAPLYLDEVREYCPKAKIIFNTVDLHYLRQQRQAAIEGSEELAREAEKTKEIELSTIRKADCTIVLNSDEREILLKEVSDKNIVFIPLIITKIPRATTSFKERRDILFVGGYQHTPNVDAVLYFTKSIWPLVKQKVPGVKLYIIGSKAPKEIYDLASNDVIIVGYIENLSDYFDYCRLSVAPLRYGAGMKGKVSTSLSYGLPCVATSIAVEGTGLKHGEEVITADGAEQFAAAVIKLYSDEELWYYLSSNGLAFVERNYSINAGKKKLDELLTNLGISN